MGLKLADHIASRIYRRRCGTAWRISSHHRTIYAWGPVLGSKHSGEHILAKVYLDTNCLSFRSLQCRTFSRSCVFSATKAYPRHGLRCESSCYCKVLWVTLDLPTWSVLYGIEHYCTTWAFSTTRISLSTVRMTVRVSNLYLCNYILIPYPQILFLELTFFGAPTFGLPPALPPDLSPVRILGK